MAVPPPSVVLVGRAEPRARLQAYVHHPVGALLVAGDAGVGKTALVRAAVEEVPTLWASAGPWSGAPYDLLDQIVPDVIRAPRSGPVTPLAVRSALRDIAAGRPLVVVLDDLHWGDEATLELVPPLVDALADDGIGLIGAYRVEDLPRGHGLRRVRAQLRHRRALAEVALGPLMDAELPEFIGAVLGAAPLPALVAAVAERTDGVPFFVEELLIAAREAGWLVVGPDGVGLAIDTGLPLPDSIRDAVLLRVARLPAPARDALDAAAVAGLEFSLAVVAELAGGVPVETDHSGLIVPVPGAPDRRRFRHELTQESLYEDIPWSRRRELHLAMADRSDTPVATARHLLAGQDLDRARPALVVAARERMDAHAYPDAARLLTVALEVWPSTVDADRRVVAIDQLVRAAELSGDHGGAVTGLRELLSLGLLPSSLGGPPSVTRRLAVQYELLGHWTPALAARESAATGYAAGGEPGEAAADRLAIATHLRSAASYRAALDQLDLAQPLAEAAGRADLIARIGGLRGNVLARMGRSEDGVPMVRAAFDLALAEGLTVPAGEIYQRLADSLEHAGDDRAAHRAYDEAYEFCAEHDQAAAGQLCRACATVILFHSGRWARALKASAAVLADPRSGDHARAVASGVDGLVHALRGQVGRARSALLDARATAGRIELVAMELLSTWGLALLDEYAGRFAQAAEAYRHAVARCRTSEERHYCVPVLMFAAARFADDGATGDLAGTTAILAEAAGASSSAGAGEAAAALAFALGCAEPDGPHYAQAVDRLRGPDRPVLDALVRHRFGVVTGSADLLAEARRTAQRLKARLLLARFGDPDEPRPTATLSGREEQVLRLVGAGLTSREIAQRLFLSVRTVEMHVRNAMVKLDSHTRAEAVRALGS